jgi:hypothetical protein
MACIETAPSKALFERQICQVTDDEQTVITDALRASRRA